MQAEFNYTIQWSIDFTAPIVLKLLLAPQNYMDISCTDVYPNPARSTDIRGIYLFTPLRKVRNWADIYKTHTCWTIFSR